MDDKTSSNVTTFPGTILSASSSAIARISESRANYIASYITDFACPFLFGYLGVRRGATWPSAVLSILFGLIVFTLIEYSIHRWLLHDPENSLYRLHKAHHDHPEEFSAFLFPLSVVALSIIWLFVTYVLRFRLGAFFTCGVAIGYCYFGALHHFEHTTRINQIPFRWLQKRWAAHSVHHRLDQSNFGVMTSFWDYVFGTHQSQRKRTSSRV